MPQIPFRVSARTARLIGRENVASAKGAIIELVKNTYDADSKVCIVYFDNRYAELRDWFTDLDYAYLTEQGVQAELLLEVYKQGEGGYQLRENLALESKASLRQELQKLNSLYIMDAGEGMTHDTIENHWMTIGTDNKSNNVFSTNGRVRSGAKGIGRFALDRLGEETEMVTVFSKKSDVVEREPHRATDKNSGYVWKVNWADFEGPAKTIDSVLAELDPYNATLSEKVFGEISDSRINLVLEGVDFSSGTILKITNLRDGWEDVFIQQVFSDLESLVPPAEAPEFSIHLFSSLKPEEYGEVRSSLCDDYDYKVVAKADEHQNVQIQVLRNEYDTELIDPALFDRDAMAESPFTLEDFKNRGWSTERTFAQLYPGFHDVDEGRFFDHVGKFEFTLYFLKKSATTKDTERFYYRRFQSHLRKEWLDHFGGIKVFRDHFRVRPYGEANGQAFDWLGLGARKASSPAGVSKESGGYRVNPGNVAGVVNISRLDNLGLEDKSSREGIQETQEFDVFKGILRGIIKVFEKDRAYVAREMNAYDQVKNAPKIREKVAEELASRILEEIEGKGDSESVVVDSSNNEVVLAELNRTKDERIEKLQDEQKLLRVLASSGIAFASFSHDLGSLTNVLDSRSEKLTEMLSQITSEEAYVNVENRKNPFYQLKRMGEDDVKIKNWVKFALKSAKKDKRTRPNVKFSDYFHRLKEDWDPMFIPRGITIDYELKDEGLSMRAFEIDFDSIFNNLLVNSFDAFIRSKEARARGIRIECSNSEQEIIMDYYDTGPGLSTDIVDKEEIFDPFFTTRRNPFTGAEEGTGLGMWILRSVVEDNDGSVKLLHPEIGFGARITFPVSNYSGDFFPFLKKSQKKRFFSEVRFPIDTF